MKNQRLLWLIGLILLAMMVVACGGGGDEPAADDAASDTTEDAATEDAAMEEETMDEEASGLPDLEGREVTIAVENAYLPFNYIDPTSGEPSGWDYEVWNEICSTINCTPVYVEAG